MWNFSTTFMIFIHVHRKFSNVFTVLWQDSDNVVTFLSPSPFVVLVEGYKTKPWFLHWDYVLLAT